MNLIDAIKTVRLFPKEEALIPLETRWGKNLDDQHVLVSNGMRASSWIGRAHV